MAFWLEKNDWRKDTSGNQTIFDVFDNLTLDASNGYYGNVKKWVEENDNIFAQAWVFGYEVEQEKLYTVEIPDPNSYCDYRYLSRNDNGICLDASNDTKWKQKKKNQFTEFEIKQDFEWAWQFAKEVKE